MRGGHYDIIICDDILKDGSSMPHADQENFYFGVITPACRKTGQIIVVGTPMEHGDLLETLENNTLYNFHKYPVLVNGKVWFDEEYTMDNVDRWKQESPNYWYFAREYLLERINPEKASFKDHWIRYYRQSELTEFGEAKPLYRIMTLDPALSAKGDYNGIIITGTDSENNTYVLESIKLRADLSTIIDRIFELYDKHKPHLVGVEMYGFQKFLKFYLEEQMAKRNCFFSVYQLEAGQKRSKSMRILGLQPKIQAGRLMFRKNEDVDLVNQLLCFDFSRTDNEDDMIDSLAYQVSLWRAPDKNDAKILPEGAFDDIVQKSEKSSATKGRDYIMELFSDMLPDDGDETEYLPIDNRRNPM